MAKTNHFANGDLVSGKKWNGEHFIGVYVHGYDCGDHLITDGNKEYCIHKKDCHHASEEEEKIIRETILKPMKNVEKASKKPQNKEIETEEEIEKLLTEE